MKALYKDSAVRQPANREGFTLIELLVVISIIMILASMLFPTFARARGTARQAVCLSNLRQCGIGLMMYAQDWDDKMPAQDLVALTGFIGSSAPRDISGPEEAVWVGQIYPYLRNAEVMRCKVADEAAVDRFNGMPLGLGLNASAASHSWPGGSGADGRTWYSSRVGIMSEPSNAMVMADCASLVFWQTNSGLMDVAYANAPSGTYTAGSLGVDKHRRHVSGSNILFADGHVKSYSPERLLAEIVPIP